MKGRSPKIFYKNQDCEFCEKFYDWKWKILRMTSNILWGKYRFILMVCYYDDFYVWMELVEALLGASKPSRSCSALTWAILCRVQFASLFDMWPLWFGQKLIMQPMHITFHGKIMEKSNVFIYFQVSKLLLLGEPSVQCIIKTLQQVWCWDSFCSRW